MNKYLRKILLLIFISFVSANAETINTTEISGNKRISNESIIVLGQINLNDKYENLDHKLNNLRANTHPHQIHYEFLAETGLVGYLSFAIFICLSIYLSIKSYLKTRNLYQLSGMFFVIISLMPLIPSGSFFSTYSSSLFWLNYAIMVSYISKETKF